MIKKMISPENLKIKEANKYVKQYLKNKCYLKTGIACLSFCIL